MLPLVDMMMRAQGGEAMSAVARQFGLGQDQANTVMAALMPAFGHGLQRSTSDPYGMGAFMAGLAAGRYMQYFEDAGRAFRPAGMADGQAVLDLVFGPPDLARAIAAQASKTSGVAHSTIHDMMAPMAAMLMGGLQKQARGDLPGVAPAPDPFREAMDQMLRQATAWQSTEQAPMRPEKNETVDNPFLQGLADNPWLRMMQDMTGTALDEPVRRTNPSGRERTPYDDFFEEMFEAGARQRDDYHKTIEALFDRYSKPRTEP